MGKRWAAAGVLLATFVAFPLVAYVAGPLGAGSLTVAWMIVACASGGLGYLVPERRGARPVPAGPVGTAEARGEVGWSEAHLAGHGACVSELERRRKRD